MAPTRKDSSDEAPSPAEALAEAETPSGAVKKVQSLLQDKGYLVASTGVNDNATVDAVKHFQSAQGLPATGMVGRGDDPTWKALNG